MQDKTKSFLKGLASGVGASLLTALVAITIYGCANVNAKGAKAYGQAEVNICYESEDNVTKAETNQFGIKYSTFAVSGSGDNYHYFLYSTIGDWEDVIGTTDFDADAPSIVYGNFTRTGDTYYVRLNADLPSSVDFLSPSFVRVYQNGAYLRDLAFVDGSSELYSFSASGSVGFETYINLVPASGSVGFYYNQPIFEPASSSSDSGSSSSEASSTSEVIYWEEYTFPRDIYPQEVFPSVTWGNAGYGPDLTGSRNVYLDMQIRYQGEFWDSILFRYIDASSGELTRYRWANGEEAEMGTGALVNPHYFYCASIQLYRTYSVGQSSYGYSSYELARVPSAVSDGGTPFQDTRLQWLVNDRTIEVYSADLANRPSVWSGGFWDSSIDNRQYLNIIGASTSEGGSAGGDDMSGVFNLITQAFGAVAVIFNMQIFPFATLGMFMLIPLVVGIVLFVVGLFKR